MSPRSQERKAGIGLVAWIRVHCVKLCVQWGRFRLLLGASGPVRLAPGSRGERWVEGNGCVGRREPPWTLKRMIPFGLALVGRPRHRAVGARRVRKGER